MSSTAVCDWPVSYVSCTTCEALTGLPPEEQAIWEQIAIDMLWNLTNRLFGTCQVDLRPCSSGCDDGRWKNTFWGRGPYPWAGLGYSQWYPVLIDGQWYNVSCGCATACNCSVEGPTAIRLPGPVAEIVEVIIDGVVLPPTAYRLDYNRILIRTDGGIWPACQNLLAEIGEPNTFVISYMQGLPVPAGGQMAAGVLACELAKAACNDATCQLPQRVQTITRQGVTVGLLDGFESLDEGKVGIWSIDAWVASVMRPKPFASVRSVDVPAYPVGKTAWPTR